MTTLAPTAAILAALADRSPQRPRLLDLFCKAGGASMGYHRAGFDVTGVDIEPQPRYPFRFVQADALEYVAAHGHEYDAIAASPPCQGYSVTRSLYEAEHAMLIPATRAALIATGKPYIIENVEGARRDMIAPVMLCGASFGLKVYRHRLFECSFFLLVPPHARHREKVLNRCWRPNWDGFLTVTGGFNSDKASAERAMGIDWMTKAELAQAIPPAYTEHIGHQLRRALPTPAPSVPPGDLIRALVAAGHADAEVRAAIWYLIDDGLLTLTRDFDLAAT